MTIQKKCQGGRHNISMSSITKALERRKSGGGVKIFLNHKPSRWSLIKPLYLVVKKSHVSVLLLYQCGGPWILLPVDLSVLVKVLQALKHIFQHGGYAGLVQDACLVLASWDDMLDDVQHWAWQTKHRTVVDRKVRSSMSCLIFLCWKLHLLLLTSMSQD